MAMRSRQRLLCDRSLPAGSRILATDPAPWRQRAEGQWREQAPSIKAEIALVPVLLGFCKRAEDIER